MSVGIGVHQHRPESDRVAVNALHSLIASCHGERLDDGSDAVHGAEAQQVERHARRAARRPADALLAHQQLRRRDQLLFEAHAKHDQLAVGGE